MDKYPLLKLVRADQNNYDIILDYIDMVEKRKEKLDFLKLTA